MAKALSKDQLKFCRERLDNWFVGERAKIHKATEEVMERPTLASIVEGIRKGKIKVSKYYTEIADRETNPAITLLTVFDIPELAGPRVKVDMKAREEAMEELDNRHDFIENQLVLGDHAEAFALISRL